LSGCGDGGEQRRRGDCGADGKGCPSGDGAATIAFIDVINASFFSIVISVPWDGGGASTG
jgi:hypothetical protein